MDDIFGKFVKLIHPFDYYDLRQNNHDVFKEIGFVAIPVDAQDGQCYLSRSPVVELNGIFYVVTTTVNPSPTCSIK